MRSPLLWTFAFVFGVRLVSLGRFGDSPYFLPESGDMRFYSDWAARILSGQLSDSNAFYGLPGYAFCLAGLFSIFGVNPYLVGLLQCGLEAITACLIYRVATLIFSSTPTPFANQRGRIVGALAAFSWAFFQPTQAFSIILMPTSWAVCAFWTCILCVAITRSASVFHPWFGLGVFAGVVAMAVATILFLIPLFIASIILTVARVERWPTRLRAIVGAVCTLGAGLFTGISPAWLHNTVVAGDSVFLSAHSGLNFWIGNNPDATGYPKIPMGLRAGQDGLLRDSINCAEEVAGRPLKRSEVSRYWSAKANSYIRANLTEWVQLLSLKVKNFWNAFQYDDLSIITLLREERILTLGVGFGFAAAFGIPGLAAASWRFPRSRWVSGAVLLHMVALLPVFITERYRLCAVPGLLILGAFAVCDCWRSLQLLDWPRTVRWCAAITASAWFVSLPQKDVALWALNPFNTGLRALETGDLERATQKLGLAEAYVPTNPEIHLAIGNLSLAKGHREAARESYQRALELNHRHASALNNLGVLALEENAGEIAERFFTAAASIDRENPKTHYLLALSRRSTGNFAGARAALAEALRLKPAQREFLDLKAQLDQP